MRDELLAEFDHEMAVTRTVIDRVPEAALDWRPHDKSYSLGELASHLADVPHWGVRILEQPVYDLASGAGRRPERRTRAEILETFDRHVAEVRQVLAGRADAELSAIWTLKRGADTLFTVPRSVAVRTFVIHHSIHHRGQMTVYLRLQDVPLPPIYGATADETL
jgi:uncharacterized damage-inducible protein DinB